ncbi:B lymphocyte-induced maturation protein 1-like protein [Frankliniella fusca]|uniref:B lymphocyte-induced maturation protein 1-like protein n=1 Tax=Frankliniella fusca TaxID=407009 RepID=A0AAE1HVX4_9NEOP|nr:B lymphocyte-induced maturation protein 1-like protein [Frankliniella fusca]
MPHECTVCNKKFSRYGSLSTHLRTHTGEKLFVYTVCNKKFSQYRSYSDAGFSHKSPVLSWAPRWRPTNERYPCYYRIGIRPMEACARIYELTRERGLTIWNPAHSSMNSHGREAFRLHGLQQEVFDRWTYAHSFTNSYGREAFRVHRVQQEAFCMWYFANSSPNPHGRDAFLLHCVQENVS